MKRNKLVFLILVFLLSACSDNKDKETVDYFLSQPRDAELLGWWKWNLGDEPACSYWYFRESGTIDQLSYITEGVDLDYAEHQYYWYTEKKDRKILYRFRPIGRLYGTDYGRGYYKIENDSLWMSSGIEGDKFFHELSLFAVKITAPEGYEHVK
jgi:hypothetical protein